MRIIKRNILLLIIPVFLFTTGSLYSMQDPNQILEDLAVLMAKAAIDKGADPNSIWRNKKLRRVFPNLFEKDDLLRAHIKELTTNRSNGYLLPMKSKIEEIKQLMLDPLTPIYTKQLALPSLLEYHQTYRSYITTKQLLSYCNQIRFNNKFFTTKNYKGIREFAIKNDAKDIAGRSILVAATYYPKSMVEKTLSTIFETKDTLYRNTGLFKKWRNQSYFDIAIEWLWGFFKERTDKEKVADDFINALTVAKKQKNKEVFKLLRDFSLHSDYLKSEGPDKKPLLPEIAAKILSYK